MKNMLKKIMGVMMVAFLLAGVSAVPSQDAQAVAPKVKNLIIPKGESIGLSNGSSDEEKWSSSNNKVAKVDEYGEVTAKKAGKAVISLKTGGKTHKVKVTVVAKVSKKDVTKIKIKKGNVNPLAKYKKYTYAVAFYTKNNKNFKGTMRGIKINSSLGQVIKKYGNIGAGHGKGYGNNVGDKQCLDKIYMKGEKNLLKKMKISGVTKTYTIDDNNGNSLVLYFNKSNKVKAVLVAKRYLELQDAIMPENGNPVDVKRKGNVLYAK